MKFFLKAFPLFLVLFLDGVGLGLVFPMLNSIIIDPAQSFLPAHISAEMRNWLFGIVVGSYMICWFFGAPVLGDFSDKIGRRKGLLICLIGAFLGYLFSALGVVLKSLSIIILGRIVAGFTSGSQSIAQAAIVDLSTEKTKTRNIGFVLLSISLGFVVGPIIGGLLADHNLFPSFTFSTPFYFVSIISLLNAVLLFFTFKETHVRKGKVNVHLTHAMKLFVSAFHSKRIRYLSACFFVFILGWSSYYTYISAFLFKKYGYSTLEVTFFLSLLGAGFALGFAVLPNFCAKRFSLKSSTIVSIFIGALCALVTFVPNTALFAWIVVVPMGTFISLAYSSCISLFSNQVNKESQGWIMGITCAIMAMGSFVIAFLSGVIQKNSDNTPIVLCFILLMVSAIMMSFEKEGKPLHGPD
jgi:DHA1 family tetracycline resistance protein-like MFS transporter